MSLNWYRARRCEKPIGGFGWRGWIALAVFLGILIPSVNGFSWQFFLLESIWRVWDWPGVYWYILKVMHPLSLSLPYPGMTIFTVLPLMVGMRLAPVRFGFWRYALLFVGAIGASMLVYFYHRPLTGFFGGVSWLLSIPQGLIAVVVTYVATRSGLLSLSWLAMVPLMLAEEWYWTSPLQSFAIPFPQMMNTNFEITPVLAVAFLVPCVVSLWWARSLRRELLTPGRCEACGYSLEGNKTGICPECGAEMGERDGGARSLTGAAP